MIRGRGDGCGCLWAVVGGIGVFGLFGGGVKKLGGINPLSDFHFLVFPLILATVVSEFTASFVSRQSVRYPVCQYASLIGYSRLSVKSIQI